MQDTITPPPLPVLSFNIGITGHRKPEGNTDEMKARLGEIFTFIKAQLHTIRNAAPCYDNNREPNCRLISPLAEGSDRIAAQVALDNGWELHAPLPFDKEEYKKDFDTPEAKRGFDELFDESDRVFELGITYNERSMAYLNVGEIVLDHSDILVAIWDGKKNNKIGGTGHIVGLAQERGIPVVWINPARPGNIKVMLQYKITEDWKSEVETIINSLTMPGEEVLKFNHDYMEQGPDNWRLASVNRIVNTALVKGIAKIQFKKPNYKLNVADEWDSLWGNSEGELEEFKKYADDNFKPYYIHLDYLSQVYADRYRSAGILRHLFYFLATLGCGIGFYYGFWMGNPENRLSVQLIRGLGFGLQAVFLFLMTYLYRKNTKAKWHQKYIDCRILSEVIRHTVLLASLGCGTHGVNLPAYLKKDGLSWINWYYRAILRQAGIPGIIINEAKVNVTRNLVANMLEQQIKYHEGSVNKNKKVGHALLTAGNFFMLFAIIAILVRVLCSALDVAFRDMKDIDSKIKLTGKLFNVLCLLFPALGLLMQSIGLQSGYDILEQRSQAMAQDLEKLEGLLAASPATPEGSKPQDAELSYPVIKKIAEMAATLMISEVADWRLFVNTKIIKKP